jgi:hypothetical protein
MPRPPSFEIEFALMRVVPDVIAVHHVAAAAHVEEQDACGAAVGDQLAGARCADLVPADVR